MKTTKVPIKSWLHANRKELCTSNYLENKLMEVDKKAKMEGWSKNIRSLRLSLLSDLWKSVRKEEQSWRQKSRVKWLIEGYTEFFHFISNDKRRRNFIGDICLNRVLASDPQEIRRGISYHFKNHYENVGWKRPKIGGLDLMRLFQAKRLCLEEEFSLEEVLVAVKSCDGNKAPGPDGLNRKFIKANWEVIEEDVMNFFGEFHKDSSKIKELNNTFLALILKISKPINMGDYRPISLVGTTYKVVAKVLDKP
ncbi:hypothetical protein Ddye_028100 [Dipteronia dyeriana]|uniref:Reverse transcriptase domain-containing protein n=1 Tax=Dipteronia dyeriana TaxID=168575 RepID=A0AAD9WS23_9ROSI|nr:hypothetical protein Ddye_028100 [Dipteronia dyeriana]